LAATIPNFLTFHLIKRGNPIFASGYEEDEEKHHTIDVYLISGAIIFGIGWGLGGLSPSPFFVLLSIYSPHITLIFTAGLILGNLLVRAYDKWRYNIDF